MAVWPTCSSELFSIPCTETETVLWVFSLVHLAVMVSRLRQVCDGSGLVGRTRDLGQSRVCSLASITALQTGIEI